MNKEEVGNFGIGLGVGFLVGAVMGLLFAPHSGKETREVIKQKAMAVGEQAKVVRDKLGKFKKGA